MMPGYSGCYAACIVMSIYFRQLQICTRSLRSALLLLSTVVGSSIRCLTITATTHSQQSTRRSKSAAVVVSCAVFVPFLSPCENCSLCLFRAGRDCESPPSLRLYSPLVTSVMCVTRTRTLVRSTLRPPFHIPPPINSSAASLHSLYSVCTRTVMAYFNNLDETKTSESSKSGYGGHFGFSNKSIRAAFVRRVFLILLLMVSAMNLVIYCQGWVTKRIQLLIVAALASVPFFCRPVMAVMRENRLALYISWCVFTTPSLLCSQDHTLQWCQPGHISPYPMLEEASSQPPIQSRVSCTPHPEHGHLLGRCDSTHRRRDSARCVGHNSTHLLGDCAVRLADNPRLHQVIS